MVRPGPRIAATLDRLGAIVEYVSRLGVEVSCNSIGCFDEVMGERLGSSL